MAKIPQMPIDLGKLYDRATRIDIERKDDVYVNIVYDATASDELFMTVHRAFASEASNVHVDERILESTLPGVALPADLCVIVGGLSLLLGDVASASRAMGIPTVIVTEEGKTGFSEDKLVLESSIAEVSSTSQAETPAAVPSGKGIPVDDLVQVNLSDSLPLQAVGTWIVQHAPAKRLSMAGAFEFLRRPLAIELSICRSIDNAAIGIVIFTPGADMPLITLNQALLVLQIAAIYNLPLDKERVKEIAVVVASAFAFRALARKLSDVLPNFLGFAVDAGVAFGATMAVGYAALEYFEAGGLVEGLSHMADEALAKAGEVSQSALVCAEQVRAWMGDWSPEELPLVGGASDSIAALADRASELISELHLDDLLDVLHDLMNAFIPAGFRNPAPSQH